MNSGNVKSHIQLPKFLLARFENEQHKFFYYDVKRKYIGTNGHAKTMNTEPGYYPDEIEKFLNNELEQPFSKILKFIDSIDLDTPYFTMTNMDKNNIKQFLVSLIVRSPLFIKSLYENSVYFHDYSQTDQHSLAITQGIAALKNAKIYDDYCVTLTVNKTEKPFILPICGLFYYSLNGYTHVSLPVSPKIAITMIEPSSIRFIEKEGATRLYLINQEKHAIQFNGFAFQQQCIEHYGCVISPSKDALEEQLIQR